MLRGMHCLKYFADIEIPDFIFLNEVQIFKSDIEQAMVLFQGEYNHALNSEDTYNQGLAITNSKAIGGTMILWKKSLDAYVTVLPVNTPSFLPILFHPPGCSPSLHISLYLPTSGKEPEFVQELTTLRIFIETIIEEAKAQIVYIRGDSNVNDNHTDRMKMLKSLMETLNLVRIPINHKTYHHFVGNGMFDSNIDVILQSSDQNPKESVTAILCKNVYPNIHSHHDIIISTINLPLDPVESAIPCSSAPVIKNKRHKIVWSDDNIAEYQELISDSLSCLRERWLNSSSKSSVSILLRVSSEILSLAAVSTNKVISLATKQEVKSSKVPKDIKKSTKILLKKVKEVKHINQLDPVAATIARSHLKNLKSNHRKLIRRLENLKNVERDQKLFSILSSSPFSIFKRIKALKAPSAIQVPFLTVGEKVFVGDNVKDGFFESIKNLKTKNNKLSSEESPWANINIKEDYRNILEICKTKEDLPNISLKKSSAILSRMKKSVNDFYSITTMHYINAGEQDLVHFNFLMNCNIDDVNNASIEALNAVYALLLYKGITKLKQVTNHKELYPPAQCYLRPLISISGTCTVIN